MKTRLGLLIIGLLALSGGITHATPLGTAFTYQGRLDQNGQPALDGIYQMTFWLYAASSGGNPLASNSVPAIPATNGLFAAAVDFGANWFTGDERWLGITVRTNNGALPFTLLSTRTRIAPAPNALYAAAAGVAGSVSNNTIQVSSLATVGVPAAGQVLAYNGSALVWQAPAAITGAWATNGNNAAAGSFVGTVNNLPLEMRVKNLTALRIVPGTDQPNMIGGPNIVGGASVNSVASDLQGATIAGGGLISLLGTPYPNRIQSNSLYGTMGGGLGNTIGASSPESTIAGGNQNTIHSNSFRSVVAGGYRNYVGTNCNTSTIAGGTDNSCGSNAAFVGGGTGNHANGSSSTLAGGYDNTASGPISFIGGGARNRASADAAVVAGGDSNTASGGHSTIGGGLKAKLSQLMPSSGAAIPTRTPGSTRASGAGSITRFLTLSLGLEVALTIAPALMQPASPAGKPTSPAISMLPFQVAYKTPSPPSRRPWAAAFRTTRGASHQLLPAVRGTRLEAPSILSVGEI